MFGMKVDMWSLGCVLAELFIGQPLFSDGTNPTRLIAEVLAELSLFCIILKKVIFCHFIQVSH